MSKPGLPALISDILDRRAHFFTLDFINVEAHGNVLFGPRAFLENIEVIFKNRENL